MSVRNKIGMSFIIPAFFITKDDSGIALSRGGEGNYSDTNRDARNKEMTPSHKEGRHLGLLRTQIAGKTW